jgi:hypothetical protein
MGFLGQNGTDQMGYDPVLRIGAVSDPARSFLPSNITGRLVEVRPRAVLGMLGIDRSAGV